MNKNIVYFDGVCGLCNGFVDYIIKKDSKKIIKFTSLQGKYAQEHLPNLKPQETHMDSVVFYHQGKYYYKSNAVLKLMMTIGGLNSIFGVFYLVPRFLRDYIYDAVARRRYSFFGQREVCRIPNKEERSYFLD